MKNLSKNNQKLSDAELQGITGGTSAEDTGSVDFDKDASGASR